MLILDEAMSSLDPLSEVYVNRMLLVQKTRGKTLLLITHKPQFLAMADQVLVMEQGRVRKLSWHAGSSIEAFLIYSRS
jgi:ABC-type multidrug transport system fused ATPase/permease subunit